MAAIKTIGTTLKNTITNEYIANLDSIGEVGIESDEIDVTDLDSEGGYKEFIAGFKDGGEVPISGFVKSEANFEDLLTLADDQTLQSFEIEFLNGAKMWFQAFIKRFKHGEITVEGVRKFTGALRISGKPVYSATGISA